jgi:uncharacterized protein YecA (UPF0149 family)
MDKIKDLPRVPVNKLELDISSLLKKVGHKISRNAPCICGSGKKFKRCCLNKVRR